ncbi:MAG: hypothetical protein PUC21_09975 [Bacteroidales bacterium]|nr:hypothetical protein [Bacteroidales bacterium]
MEKKQTITSKIQELEIGQNIEFPAELCASLRSMASTLGFRYNRKYKTEADRERRLIVVTRLA